MSNYKGDFDPGDFVRHLFNTHTAAGAPITLAGTPTLAVYSSSDAATGTGTGVNQQTLGVDMVTDYDAVTGMHMITVDTAIDPTFYCAGNDYFVVLTAGTVDGQSVAGTVLFAFSIHNRSFQGNDLADLLLKRNVSNVEAVMPEHCLGTIILAVLEYAISGTTWTIQRTDGSTTHVTKTLTTDAAAEHVTGVE